MKPVMKQVLPLCILVVSLSVAASQSEWASPLESSAKVSPQERQQLSEKAASNAQKAYAPTKSKVAAFLASDAQVVKACPACGDKDYSDACPLGWTELTDGSCAAPKTYEAACSNKQVFIGSSVAEKMEVELSCAICWPCSGGGADSAATCVRDWAQPCPNGYSPQDLPNNEFSEASGVTCVADLTYEGECEAEISFKDSHAKQEFSERCQTSWPCKPTCEGGVCTEGVAALEPSTATFLGEAGHGLRSASFLAARVIPETRYKIRNSLYLTQLLRSPAQASINVVEQEDPQRVYEEAKYKAMQGRALRLDRALETKLQLLTR